MSRYLYFGAHPDDPEVCFAGTALQLTAAGHVVQYVSLTNGDRGHHRMPPEELARRRYGEAQKSASLSGIAEYRILDNHDTELEASLENRHRLIRIIREFRPDVVITHRSCDYHPDHRAAGQLVMDASFLIGVPHCCPDSPVLRKTPVFCCSRDSFLSPVPFRADAVVDITGVIDRKADLLLCHESQFLEWLPWIERNMDLDKESMSPDARRAFVREHWLEPFNGCVAAAHPETVRKYFREPPRYAEAFEISEYGRRISADEFQALMTSF